IDALGRSLSLVSVPDPAHAAWLGAEARHLAHLNHPVMPTTYHYWIAAAAPRRGPGYLRRWLQGETLGARLRRSGVDGVSTAIRVLREVGSALTHMHDAGSPHGAVSPNSVWLMPMGRIWLLGWQWALPRAEIPGHLSPDFRWTPRAPEWEEAWAPTPASDQWQLAAVCFAALSGELPPSREIPPVQLVCPECPQSLATILERALEPEPDARFPSITWMVRALDRVIGTRTPTFVSADVPSGAHSESEETRLRWLLADDYEVLTRLGAGSFGSVWRVRDLSLGREVALKLLHPHVARDHRAVSRFRREARLAAQLAHPAIVPIYDWDSRGSLSWYTMELAEGGSVADLVARAGPRPLAEIGPQVDFALSGLTSAHSVGIIHRDLKPENILIDRYQRWRITDFGIANAAGEDQSSTTGTPAFAAPEQLLGEAQDSAADCFSLAAIVAFTLSGKPPFGDRDAKAILARQLSGQLDLSEYPAPVAVWLRRGLAPTAEERFPDAAAMQEAWREAAIAALDDSRRVPWWRRWFAPDVPAVIGAADEPA
ncbi:MAG: serine/threonine-protein kinase, partial [Gemmatimonadota bacterium]|nr:serine/threonine-protein kinase [Gemmatimonadota bacterium]